MIEFDGDIYYQEYINHIGGVETFLYELVKKYKDRSLMIICSGGDEKQIERLKYYVQCKKFNNEPIKCDKAFFNYSVKIIDKIIAREYIQIVHADFLDPSLFPKYKPIISNKISKYYAVSKNNAESFKQLTGLNIDVAYNPITIEKQAKLLRLIAPQRLSSEKGGKRLEYLVKELDKNNIAYELQIFSDATLGVQSPNVIYRAPTLNIRTHIYNSDYLVLLSDTEGFCYGLYEALCMGKPVICTKLPILEEMGVNKDNGIVLEFDMSNLDVHEIYNKAGTFKFEYEPKKDIWGELLTTKKNKYKEELGMKYKVIATDAYSKHDIIDKELNRIPEEGEEFIVSKLRLDVLLGENAHGLKFVKVIEEIQDKKTTRKRTKKGAKDGNNK